MAPLEDRVLRMSYNGTNYSVSEFRTRKHTHIQSSDLRLAPKVDYKGSKTASFQ